MFERVDQNLETVPGGAGSQEGVLVNYAVWGKQIPDYWGTVASQPLPPIGG